VTLSKSCSARFVRTRNRIRRHAPRRCVSRREPTKRGRPGPALYAAVARPATSLPRVVEDHVQIIGAKMDIGIDVVDMAGIKIGPHPSSCAKREVLSIK